MYIPRTLSFVLEMRDNSGQYNPIPVRLLHRFHGSLPVFGPLVLPRLEHFRTLLDALHRTQGASFSWAGKLNQLHQKAAVLRILVVSYRIMDFGFTGEIFFIMLLALILFGPRKLPEIARTIGKFMAEFRRASNEFQGQIHEEVRKLELEEADPRKHLEPEMAKIAADDDVSISGALNRLSDRIKNNVPQDYDA